MIGSTSRFNAIKAVNTYRPISAPLNFAETPAHSLFGSNVFSSTVMQARLPKGVFKSLKRTIDAGTSALERLIGAGSLDKAVEVQSDYVRTAYEGYVAQVAKVSEIVTDMAKGAYEPYEAMFGKFGR